jgi:branched-chain amino acid transport system permease protein
MISQFIIYGVLKGSIYFLIAVGFSLIFRTVRFFHFAHGAIYTAGAYFAFLFNCQIGLDWSIAFPLACISTMLLGVALEVGIYNPMRKRKASDLSLLIASLGLYVVLQNLISMIWGDTTKTIRTGDVMEGHEFFGARITNVQLMIVMTSLVLVAMMAFVMTRTKFGKTLRALANDPELARLNGVKLDRYIMYVFAIGSSLAAVAAIMISLDTDMTPIMGFNMLIKGVIAVIIGGTVSLPGAALGALFLGLAENLGVYWLPSKWQDTIAFVILILFLLLRPYGVLGKKTQKAQV